MRGIHGVLLAEDVAIEDIENYDSDCRRGLRILVITGDGRVHRHRVLPWVLQCPAATCERQCPDGVVARASDGSVSEGTGQALLGAMHDAALQSGHPVDVLAVASLALGFLAVRRRDHVRHSEWMSRAYAIGIAQGTIVMVAISWILLIGPVTEPGRAVLITVPSDPLSPNRRPRIGA